jgi:hypothetical protein
VAGIEEAVMDILKVDNFHRANPSAEFPRFTHLTTVECTQLRATIAERIGLDRQIDSLALVDTLWATAEFVPDIDADNGFDLHWLISSRGLKSGADVFINWQRFDNIDRFDLSDLCKHFSDIWYPSSDDIEIFDASLDWFVFVRHDGRVRVLDLTLSRNQSQ